MEGIIHFLSTNRELFCEDVWNDADMGESSCTWCPKETNGPLTSIVLFPWSPWNNLIFSLWPEVGCRMSRGVWWGPRLFQEANSL